MVFVFLLSTFMDKKYKEIVIRNISNYYNKKLLNIKQVIYNENNQIMSGSNDYL